MAELAKVPRATNDGRPEVASGAGIPLALVFLLAVACGVVAAGSYMAQPMVETISAELGMPAWSAGLIVACTQVGYCLGLVLLGPLADVVENRGLLVKLLSGSVGALLLAAVAGNGPVFLLACVGIGVSSTAVQVFVTIGATLAHGPQRGRVVGSITSGLLGGILLARPAASFVAHQVGWRALFGLDAAVIAVLLVVLASRLPVIAPASRSSYRRVVTSLWTLYRHSPRLRGLAFGQALLFAAFSLFWTAAPLELVRHHGLDQNAVGLFALVGAGGALAAPVAGRLADAGRSRSVAVIGMAIVAVAFMASAGIHSVAWLAVCGLALDAGIQANHVVTQRAVLSIDREAGNRLNSLYIATFIGAGAMGSGIAAPLAVQGWQMVAAGGACLALVALARFLLQRGADSLN